ncbi:hypothetical protein [Deinococcus yavapaiensis]|uniref:Uncharacterized protein n=1 Tax=Deinococcus yavapaiensis KR-236 TaxID=694435 RepID=A0A318S349_9DEIO|nr:hypothetical protein [Deinococcus yavapaiensis]PYE48367.1 hypothetical protein DES52_13010 [Deinococcus yavapaiensis KR-236]
MKKPDALHADLNALKRDTPKLERIVNEHARRVDDLLRDVGAGRASYQALMAAEGQLGTARGMLEQHHAEVKALEDRLVKRERAEQEKTHLSQIATATRRHARFQARQRCLLEELDSRIHAVMSECLALHALAHEERGRALGLAAGIVERHAGPMPSTNDAHAVNAWRERMRLVLSSAAGEGHAPLSDVTHLELWPVAGFEFASRLEFRPHVRPSPLDVRAFDEGA